MTARFGFTLTRNRIARLVLAIAAGSAVGIMGYTFVYAKGYSYLSNDPSACANCHIMNEQYDGWTRSSHHAVATCNDCHTPPDMIGKYMTKAVERVLAFVLFHDRCLSRADPNSRTQCDGDREGVPQVPQRHGRRDRGFAHRRPRALLCALSSQRRTPSLTPEPDLTGRFEDQP